MQPSSEFEATPTASRLSWLFCMLVPLSFGCGDTPRTSPQAPNAGARCDLDQLRTSAAELASKRDGWDTDAPLDQGQAANDALHRACGAEFLEPYEHVLAATLDDRQGYPLYLKPTYGTKRACPHAEKVATSAPTKPAAERPGFIYDACAFERYSSVISRDSFITLRMSTGVAALFELGEALRAEGLAKESGDALIRELVLQSGTTDPPSDDSDEP